MGSILRRLEYVSIATTALAFALTVWLVSVGAAKEVNPFVAGFLEALGWSATAWAVAGVVAIAVEGIAFAYLRRRREAVPRGTVIGGVLIASVGVADLALNLWLLSLLDGVSLASFYAEKYAPVVVLVLVVALYPVVIRATRRSWRQLRDAVTVPTATRRRQVALALTLAVLTTTAAIVPFLGFVGIDSSLNKGGVDKVVADDGTGLWNHTGRDESVISTYQGTIAANDTHYFALDQQDGDINVYNDSWVKVNEITPSDSLDAISAQGDTLWYIAGNDLIERNLTDGSETAHSLPSEVSSASPSGLAFDSSGTAWVVNGSQYFELNSTYTGVKSSGGLGVDSGVIALTFTEEGTFWAIKYPDTVREYDSEFNYQEKHTLEANDKAVGISYDTQAGHFIVSDQETDKVTYYGTGGGLGSTVSGTVSDSSGDSIESATVELLDSSDSVISSTTTASDGTYSFSGVSDQSDLQVRVKADKYGTNTTSAFDVNGSDVTGKDVVLTGNVKVIVADESGDKISNATVVAISHNQSAYTGTANEIEDKIDDVQQNLSNPTPPDWEKPSQFDVVDQQFDRFGSGVAVAVHPEGAWLQGGAVNIPDYWNGSTGDSITEPVSLDAGPRLQTPRVVYGPDEPLWLSCWDLSKGGIQDGVDEDLPGATTADCTIEVTRLGPAGSELSDPLVVEPEPVFQTGIFGTGKTHAAARIPDDRLATGFYEVQPQSQPSRSYVIAVAPNRDPSTLTREIRTSLKDRKGNLVNRAADVEEKINNAKVSKTRKKTGPDGVAYIPINQTLYSETQLYAYKKPATLSGTTPENVTRQDITTHYESRIETARQDFQDSLTEGEDPSIPFACNGASSELSPGYISDGVVTKDVPNDNVVVPVRQVGVPPEVDIRDQLCTQADIADYLRENGLGQLVPGILGTLEDKSRAELETLYSQLKGSVETNPEACKAALRNRGLSGSALSDCTAGEDGTPDAGDDGVFGPPDNGGSIPSNPGSDVNTTELQTTIRDLQQTVEELRETTQDDETSTSVGNTTLNATHKVPMEIGSDDTVTVEVHYSNASSTVLNRSSEYVSVVDCGALAGCADKVRLRNFPLGEDAPPQARVQFFVATEEEVSKGEDGVTNPTYSGQIPSLASVRVSSLTPTPDQRVTVALDAPDTAPFGSLQKLEVEYPNGTTSTVTSVTDGTEAVFRTGGDGAHRVTAVFSSSGGSNFSEVIVVDASTTGTQRDPALKGQSGQVGRYALVTGPFDRGSYEVRQGGQRVSAAATLKADADVPDAWEVHVEHTDFATTSTVTARMLRGSDEGAVRKNVKTRVYLGRVEEDALIWAGETGIFGNPVTTDESAPAYRVRENGSVVVVTRTDAHGRVQLTVNRDPGLLAEQSYQFAAWTRNPSLPVVGVLFGALSPAGDTQAAGLIWLALLVLPTAGLVAVRRWSR